MTMTNSEIADVLDKAHDLLMVKGRCTGKGLGDDGGLCVEAAICEAMGGDPAAWSSWHDTWPAPLRALDSHLRVTQPPNYCSPYFWNDHEATDDDVFDALRNCAKRLREQA